ncbi:MAG: hypothetical protein ACLP0J_23710 [Solirubrobacteraceae bacterium]
MLAQISSGSQADDGANVADGEVRGLTFNDTIIAGSGGSNCNVIGNAPNSEDCAQARKATLAELQAEIGRLGKSARDIVLAALERTQQLLTP